MCIRDRQTQRAPDMSLELTGSLKQQVPDALSISSFNISRDRHYFAHIEVEPAADVDPQEQQDQLVVINTLQSWRLILTDLSGAPIRNAQITYNGHMPGHVHGLPTQPRVTEELAPGVYRISGVKFQMRGWWVIDLEVESPAAAGTKTPKLTDNIRFNLQL